MPQGKGTYGSKRGRPKKSKKKGKATKASAMDMMYGAETDKMKTYAVGGNISEDVIAAKRDYAEGLYGGTSAYDMTTQSARELSFEDYQMKTNDPEGWAAMHAEDDATGTTGGKKGDKKMKEDPTFVPYTVTPGDDTDDDDDYDPYTGGEKTTPKTDRDRIRDKVAIGTGKLGDIGDTLMYNEGGNVQSSDARGRSQKIKGYGKE